MTPDLSKLLVRPALKRWLVENGYGWQEDYGLQAGVVADVYATSRIHQHAMAVLPVRAVSRADLGELARRCRQWQSALPCGIVAIAVPVDGIIESIRLKLVVAKIRVIVLESTMTQKQYDAWLQSDWRSTVPMEGSR